MSSIIEALPELLISLIFVVLLFLFTREKLSAKTRNNMLACYGVGVLVTLILLFQSGTPPQNTLNTQESFAATDVSLAEIQDHSPKTLSAEESSERLNKLIEQQKQNVSVVQETTANSDADSVDKDVN